MIPSPFVLITGGKGGVGKTTLTANLGVQLARSGRRVLVVDLDLGLANLDIFLGLKPERSIADALAGRCALRDCISTGPSGVDLLPASSGAEEMGRVDSARRRVLIDGLSELATDYDLVLGDSAAGIGPDVLDFAALADRVIVTTTPEIAALTDAYGLIKALHQLGTRRAGDIPTPEVVVNCAQSVEEGRAVARKLQAVCERFLSRSPRQVGWLPRSAALAASAQRQRPLEPAVRDGHKSLEIQCLDQIAARLGRLVRATSVASAP